MRFPWSSQSEPEPDVPGFYDPEPTPEGDGEGDPEPDDPLAELDDDTRTLVEGQMERARQEVMSQMRTPLQQAGLDVVDGRLVGDPQRFSNWMTPQQQAAAQPPPNAPPPAAPEEEEFDPFDRDSVQRRIEREVEKRLSAVQEQQQGTFAALQGQLIDDAIERLPQAIEARAPWLKGIQAHPDFAQAFRDGLASSDPKSWRDPAYLASVAGAIAPHLPQRPQAQPPAQRDASGRFTPVRETQQPQRQTARVPLGQLGSSPSGRGPAPEQLDDTDRLVMDRLGVSAEMAKAAADPTGRAIRQVRERERERASRRR